MKHPQHGTGGTIWLDDLQLMVWGLPLALILLGPIGLLLLIVQVITAMRLSRGKATHIHV